MQRKQEEQHAEHILALGGPGYRLDVDRVQGKQRGHAQTAPGKSGRPLQQQKKEHSIGRMQQKIYVVMAGGIEAKELAVQGVRQPGQRMPVSVAKGGERPLHGIPCQAAMDLGIFQDIRRVIKVDELVMDDGTVESESGRDQQETEDDDSHFVGRGHVGKPKWLRRPKARSLSSISRPPAKNDSNGWHVARRFGVAHDKSTVTSFSLTTCAGMNFAVHLVKSVNGFFSVSSCGNRCGSYGNGDFLKRSRRSPRNARWVGRPEEDQKRRPTQEQRS